MRSEQAMLGIDPAAVTDWLVRHVDGLAPPLTFTLVAGGRSNLTYRVTDAAGSTWALRRPPVGSALATAHDMAREWAFVSALGGSGVPVPEAVAFCADTSVVGAQFYVMGWVDGTVLDSPAAARRLTEPARWNAGMAIATVLAELGRVDPARTGLDGVRRGGRYVERQLRRWRRQVEEVGSADLDELVAVHDALAANIPDESTGIVHGDLRPGNMAFSPDGVVAAVFDWELATIGPPLADLGWLLATWREPGEDFNALYPPPSLEPGFPSRDQIAARYAELTDDDLADLPYYIAFALWRLACIGAEVRSRYLAGGMADDGYRELLERGGDDYNEAYRALAAVRELNLL